MTLSWASADVTQAVSVGLDDPMLRLLGDPRVKVTARLAEVKGRRTFEDLAVAVRGGSAQLRPATVRVIVAGPPSVLDRLKPEDLAPYITLDPRATGAAQTAPVAVDMPRRFPDSPSSSSSPRSWP